MLFDAGERITSADRKHRLIEHFASTVDASDDSLRCGLLVSRRSRQTTASD